MGVVVFTLTEVREAVFSLLTALTRGSFREAADLAVIVAFQNAEQLLMIGMEDPQAWRLFRQLCEQPGSRRCLCAQDFTAALFELLSYGNADVIISLTRLLEEEPQRVPDGVLEQIIDIVSKAELELRIESALECTMAMLRLESAAVFLYIFSSLRGAVCYCDSSTRRISPRPHILVLCSQ